MEDILDNDHSSGAVLRIISEIKSIDDISMIINARPTRYFIKGQPYSRRNPNSKKRESNIWLLESGLDNKNTLESHITHLLSFINEKAEAFRDLQVECHVDIMCSFSSKNGQGGFILNQELLKGLTENAIELVVNLYPHEGQ